MPRSLFFNILSLDFPVRQHLTIPRLITCEADKTVKIWKEQAEADPESHPIDMESWTKECRRRR